MSADTFAHYADLAVWGFVVGGLWVCGVACLRAALRDSKRGRR